MSKRGAKPHAAKATHASSRARPKVEDLLAIRKALTLLQERRYDESQQICEAVLAHAPDLVYANHAMGLLYSTQLNYTAAEGFLRKAVEADPENAEYLTNLGTSLLRQDRIDEAIAQFEAAIAESAEYAPARIGLADALHEKNDPAASIAYFEDAVRREPGAPGPLTHLAKAMIDAGRHKEAVDVLLQAMALKMDYAPAHTNLAIAFHEMGMLEEAIQCHETADLLDSRNIYALNKMADTYIKQRDFDKANEIYRRVIELAPHDPNSHLKLGSSLFSNEGRYEEAMQLFHHALSLDASHAITHNNIGATMFEHGHIEEGRDYFYKAIALRPNYKVARHNLAFAQLMTGDFRAGWESHEVRLTLNERKAVYVLVHKLFEVIPPWDGKSSLKDKHVLLMHEQGFGDAIQFVRYARILQQQGARVAIHVLDPLERLFRTVAPDIKLVKHTDLLPNCDCSYLLMSLPHALGTDSIAQIPASPAYLSSTAEDAAKWQRVLRVGLVWAGNPEHANDRRRSIPLAALAPLLEMQDIQFVSLQKGGKPEDLARLETDFHIINAGADCKDFADTAGVIANLDLVVSVDTSVVHLAGAMGAPTWTLLAYVPDWRWLRDRSDSPWYPGMRLIRQREREDWSGVIAEVKAGLTEMLGRARAENRPG
jgi:tetratricopeptide (TPR) repeat protein